MNRSPSQSDRSAYISLALINLCVAMMFGVAFVAESAIQRTPPTSSMLVGAAPVPITAKEKPIRPVVGTAKRLVVPSVGIDVEVRSGSYDAASQSWSIGDGAAYHADLTVPVNNTNGTSLIYGHAKWPVFISLPDITEGAVAHVYTKEGYRFDYSYSSKRQVSPTDVSLLKASGPPVLLLQTCSGPLDAYRTMVSFRLIGVERDD